MNMAPLRAYYHWRRYWTDHWRYWRWADQPDDTDDIRTVDDQHFIVKASLAVEDFNAAFQTKLSRENTDTIGGIILGQLGYIQKRHKIVAQGLQIEVYSASEK